MFVVTPPLVRIFPSSTLNRVIFVKRQCLNLTLLWHILFDYDIFSFIVSYVGQINLFLIGLVVFLSSIYVTIFTICKVTKYMSSKIFYLLNCMNLIFSYFMSNKFYEVASLGGQNELLPANQMVVILWIIFFAFQILMRIICNKN